jgi:hypothetical protein
MGTSMNYATAIAVITPKVAGFPPLTYQSDTFFNEEEFLSEPQPARERARQFMSNDGLTVQYIDTFAKAGKRDITLLDGPQTDFLVSMANSNPQPLFDLNFTYQRNDQLASEVRAQMHYDCKIMNHPIRALSNDVAVIKFTIAYARLELLDATGNPV